VLVHASLMKLVFQGGESENNLVFLFCFRVSILPNTYGGETHEFIYDFMSVKGVGIIVYNTNEVHSFEFLFGLLHNTSWTNMKPS
jgi:hypothetical protein